MRKKFLTTGLMLASVLAVPKLVVSQATQGGTLMVSGQPGQASVLQINGKSYVEIEGLARLTNGSLSFKGNQILLTLPASAASTTTTSAIASPPVSSGFSKDFMRAGIEVGSTIR